MASKQDRQSVLEEDPHGSGNRAEMERGSTAATVKPSRKIFSYKYENVNIRDYSIAFSQKVQSNRFSHLR